jgi:dephospho-CoA kinase
MRIIGLCGSIGCGKSTRCKYAFRAINAAAATATAAYNRAVLLDADKAAHALYEPGSATYNKVVEAFGRGILADAPADPTPPTASASTAAQPIDRRRLGGVVFADPSKMALLNSIVWPPLAESVWAQIQEATAAAPSSTTATTATTGGISSSNDRSCYLLEAALLPEMKPLLSLCDEVWLFYADEDVAVPRVVARGFSEEEARKRIAAQPTWEARAQALEAAGYVRVPAGAAPATAGEGESAKRKVYRVFDTNNTTEAGLEESLKVVDSALGL